MAIYLNVTGQKLSPARSIFMAAGTLNYPEAIFSFDDDWTGFSKIATFCNSNSQLYRIVLKDDRCVIPSEVMVDNEIVSIGVYGTKGNVRITTNALSVPCNKSGYGLGVSPSDPGIDIITQIQQSVADIQANYATKKFLTNCIMWSINGLHPEYTQSYTTETIETESDKTMTCTVDLTVYNPDKSDGLLVTADGVLINPLAYTATVENNAAKIHFFASAGLQIGQTVNFTYYHKPQNGSGIVAGEVVAMSNGMISEALTGTPGQIIDLMDYDLITTDTYTSSVPASGEYIEIKDFQKWFSVNSNQAIQVVFKYDDEKQAMVRMKINGVHNSCTGSDDGYFVVSELHNYQGVATTVRPLIVVDGIADLSKLTQFYMIITEV